jgi:ankyrin repeat protein
VLMWAANSGIAATAAELVRLGADVGAEDKVQRRAGLAPPAEAVNRARMQNGQSALDYAKEQGHKDIVDLLTAASVRAARRS